LFVDDHGLALVHSADGKLRDKHAPFPCVSSPHIWKLSHDGDGTPMPLCGHVRRAELTIRTPATITALAAQTQIV
jgi:hypothetical protein